MMQKARTGTKAGVFRTAVDLLQRSWAEVGADDLAPFVDDATWAQHVLAADVVDVLARQGASTAASVVDGALPWRARSPTATPAPAARRGEPAGVRVDDRPDHSIALTRR